MASTDIDDTDEPAAADWQRRVVERTLSSARERSIDRGSALIRAATALLERSGRDGLTVQGVADEAGQSVRTLYQYFASKDDLLLAVFEDAMWTYARLVRGALDDLEDPLDRLIGGLIALTSLPEATGSETRGGLARLRLSLAEVEPDAVGRARAPIAGLLLELVRAAADAGEIDVDDDGAEAATYLLLSLNTASVTSQSLGNDVGISAPPVEELVAFCLRALGASVDEERYASVAGRLRLRGA